MMRYREEETLQGLIGQSETKGKGESSNLENAQAVALIVRAMVDLKRNYRRRQVEIQIEGHIEEQLIKYLQLLIAESVASLQESSSEIKPLEMIERIDARYTLKKEDEDEAIRVFQIMQNVVFKVRHAAQDRREEILLDAIADLTPSVVVGDISASMAATMLFDAGHYSQAGEGIPDWTMDDAKAIIDMAFPGELDKQKEGDCCVST